MIKNTNLFKVVLMLVSVFITYSAQAQWSNGSGGIYYNSGKVGIHTTSPQAPLHIGYSSFSPVGTSPIPSIRLSYHNNNATTDWDLKAEHNLTFQRNGSSLLRVTNNGINVYGNELFLGTGAEESYFGKATNAVTGKLGSAIVFGGKPVGLGYQFFGNPSENGGGAIMADHDGNMYFLTKAAGSSSTLTTSSTISNISMQLNNDGRVNIGEVDLPSSFQNTAAKEYRLFVRGGIYTQEVTVNLNNTIFPDYVFEEDYNLPTLQEIETFITENKHLPNTPSAETLSKEGMNLKEIAVIQQESIEQLYLHIIALEKRIKELEEEK